MRTDIDMLIKWRENGTLNRIYNAMTSRTPVAIRRSSGAFVSGIIASCGGFGGLMCVVAWGENTDGVVHSGGKVHCPPGVLCKQVDTEDLLSWNQWLAGQPSTEQPARP